VFRETDPFGCAMFVVGCVIIWILVLVLIDKTI
jgi:hypothetical protein